MFQLKDKKKRERDYDKRTRLLGIIKKLDERKIGDPLRLQRIVIDLEEEVPLKKEDIDYIKELIALLDNGSKSVDNTSKSSLDNNADIDKEEFASQSQNRESLDALKRTSGPIDYKNQTTSDEIAVNSKLESKNLPESSETTKKYTTPHTNELVKDSQQSSLIQVINTLQREGIGYRHYLDEIKMNLEENTPLSQEKVGYLKESIDKLKENRAKTTLPEQEQQTKSDKTQQAKPWFKNILSKKKSAAKSQEKIIENKSEEDTDSYIAASPTTDTKNSENKQNQTSSEKKRFFRFFGKKQKTIASGDHASKESTIKSDDMDVLSNNETDESTTPNKNNFHDKDKISDLPDATQTEQEPDVYYRHSNKAELEMETILLKEKQVSKFEKTKILELDEIKQVLEELNKEKDLLKSDVDEVKSRFSVKALLKKYEQIEQRLQSVTNSLYSVQSEVYDRIKEVRMLRRELGTIKEDLGSI